MTSDGTRLAAFEAHFRALSGPVRRYAVRAIGPSAADDVVSETFATAWRRWDDAPDDPGLRRAWTYRIAHHVVSHQVRSQLRRTQLLRRVGSVRPAEVGDLAERVAQDDRVARALAALPLGEREALALVVWADMSPQQAAHVLGCSATAVSSRVARARTRLAAAGAEVMEPRAEEPRVDVPRVEVAP